MKKIAVFSLVVIFLSCSGNQDLSPSATAEVVSESFYHSDEETLKAYTTPEGFKVFSNIQKMFAKSKNSETNFKVIDKKIEEDVAWVKYTTSYDKTPGIFKLIKTDGKWRVTARKPREKVPF